MCDRSNISFDTDANNCCTKMEEIKRMQREQVVTCCCSAFAGPGLVFIIYPQAVTLLPWPQVWSVCFFTMIILLGIDGQVSRSLPGPATPPPPPSQKKCPLIFLLWFRVFKLSCLSVLLQFIGLESLMTSLSDVYPSQIRKGYRRELLLMIICAVGFGFSLLLVSEVRSTAIIGYASNSS